MLKEVLKGNKFKGDKDLYIATLPENEYSKKVAINNGGKLIYSGNVPADDSTNFISCVKKVKAYLIKM